MVPASFRLGSTIWKCADPSGFGRSRLQQEPKQDGGRRSQTVNGPLPCVTRPLRCPHSANATDVRIQIEAGTFACTEFHCFPPPQSSRRCQLRDEATEVSRNSPNAPLLVRAASAGRPLQATPPATIKVCGGIFRREALRSSNQRTHYPHFEKLPRDL